MARGLYGRYIGHPVTRGLSAYEVKNNFSLCKKPFKMTDGGVFLFAISSLVLEIFTIFYYANEITDDVTNCSNMVLRHKMSNISANNGLMHLNLGNNNVLKAIHHMVHILMLLWQHSLFQFSFCFASNITICDFIRRNTSFYSKHT